MAFVLADRVRETTTTAGTGAVSLGGAVSGFQSFSTAIGNANNTYYTIADSNTGAWEVGIGTYTSSGNTLSRDTVLSSSNSGNLVNFAANAKDVFVTQPASRAVFVQDAGTGLQTGTTAFTVNRILYANAASTTTTSANLTFDGTTLTANALTTTSTVTINGGAANGVAYLNGSKVLTTGGALTFDGSVLTLGTSTALPISGSKFSIGNDANSALRLAITNQNAGASALVGIDFQPAGGGWKIDVPSDTTSFTPPMYFKAGAGTNVTFAYGGNVGIGTSSPSAKLQVGTRSSSGDTNNSSVFTAGTASASGGIADVATFANTVAAATNNETRITFTPASNYSATAAIGAAIQSTSNGQTALKFYTYNNGADPLTERMRLDSSGNLGLGVTPSAWSVGKALQVGSTSSVFNDGSGATYFGNNFYYNSGFKYLTSNVASYYLQGNGHQWHIAPSGTAGNAISFTQAMTLDASGNLGIGVTSIGAIGSSKLVEIGATTGNSAFLLFNINNARTGAMYSNASETSVGSISATPLLLKTGDTERARITSGGYFKASNTGGYDNVNGTFHELLNNDSGDPVVQIIHFGATNPNGIKLDFTAASPDDNTQYFLRCADSTAARCFIYSDGDLANHDGVYGTISDERLKQDIVDAGSQWNDIKAIRFRKYRMKSDVAANPDAPALLGVVAQELEQVSPGLIDEHPDKDVDGNDLGTTTKTVKSSILLMKAAVALQEAMARIEKLEAEVAALKGA